jgi:broad specificity phosphatase PhoE
VTELIVVRHGQASYGAADYDVLSPLGHRQSALLGEWLAKHAHEPFDLIVHGAMVRHRDTLSGITGALAAAGHALPDPIELPGLNEFDHRAVIGAYAKARPNDAAVLAAEHGRAQDLRAVYAFLRGGLTAWAAGELDSAVPESWSAFRNRIAGAVDELAAACNGRRRALVVTSGGVMSQLAQLALDVPSRRAVELNLTIRNSAVCEFHLSQGQLSLMSWNTLPHLAHDAARDLITWY